MKRRLGSHRANSCLGIVNGIHVAAGTHMVLGLAPTQDARYLSERLPCKRPKFQDIRALASGAPGAHCLGFSLWAV